MRVSELHSEFMSSQRVSVLSENIKKASTHENVAFQQESNTADLSSGDKSPLARAMLAKFNKTFENRTLETPEKQKIADSALQHLER